MAGDLTKNRGPLLQSYNVGGENVISKEWIAKAGTYQEEQEMPLGFLLAGTPNGQTASLAPAVVPPGSILLDEQLVQSRTDERKRTTVVLNPPPGIGGPPPGGGPPGSWTMVDELRLPVGKVATRTRALVPEGSHLVLTDDMLQAEQKNLGPGVVDQTVLTTPLPSAAVVDEKLNEAAAIATTTKTRKLITSIVTGESIVTHVPASPLGGLMSGPTPLLPPIETYWIRVAREGETETVATEVRVVERLGSTTILSYQIEADGGLVTIAKTRKQTSKIAKGEVVLGTTTKIWVKTHAEGESGLVATEVVETRALPTPTVVTTRIESDGITTAISKRKRATIDIVNGESIVPVTGGKIWQKVYKEGESGLIATEVYEQRFMPTTGAVISSVTFDGEYQQVGTARKLMPYTDITPSATIVASGTQIQTVEAKEVSDLVSEYVGSLKPFTDKAVWGLSREVPLPAEYRGLLITQEEDHVVRGDVGHRATLPTLASGEIEKTEQQLDNLLKRTTKKSVSSGTLPVVQTTEELTEEYGGLVLDNTKTLDVLGAASLNIPDTEATDIAVVSDKVTPYGAFGVRERRTKKGGEAYHVLQGTEIDSELNFAVPFTQQVVPAGTVGSVDAGTSTEIRPIDAARSLKIVKTVDTAISSAFDNFLMEYPGTTNVDFPPELTAINVSVGSIGGTAASHSESGNYNIVNEGAGRMDLTATASASAAATLEVVPVIKQVHGNSVPCDNYIFFIGGVYPVVTYADVIAKLARRTGLTFQRWPKFKPEAVQILSYGKKATVQTSKTMYRASSFVGDGLGNITRSGGATSDGAGYSFENEMTVKTISIPPTIHGSLTFSSGMTPSTSTAQSFINMNGSNYNTAQLVASAAGSLSTGSVTATAGQSTIPGGSQGYIHHMRCEPYKFGYFKCFVEIVYANDW